MNPRNSQPAKRPVPVALCLIALTFVIAFVSAATAHAAEYKMLGCSGSARDPFYTIDNNTTSPQNPAGIFNFQNNCGGQGGDPPGGAAYLRIEENQANGSAGNNAKLAFNFDTPNQFIHFRSVSAYTREPVSFNEGWRSRLLISGGSAGERELFAIGGGLCNCGNQFRPTIDFAQHGWPFGGYLDFTRLTWEMVCMSWGNCDRSGVNIADLNGLSFVLSDEYRSAVNLLATDQPFMAGAWVRGPQTIAYNWTELGSGMRMERVRVDNGTFAELPHNCDVDWSPASGDYARTYQPCDTAADIKRYFPIETANLGDGAHTIAACTQDYAQWANLGGSGGESCDSRVVRTDNTAPGAPTNLVLDSANPNRYLDRFGAQFGLPPNQGSPVSRVHYDVINAAGAVVKAEKVISAVNPTALSGIEGPATAGDYRLRVWLEDQVGFTGPAAIAPIPHDTVPPAAPQGLWVATPQTSRATDGFDARWRNLTDSGSPIDGAHYQVLDPSGKVVVATHDLSGEDIQSIADLDAPKARGEGTLRLWLSDAEGNVGAPVSAPLSYDCSRSEVPGGTNLSARFGDAPDGSALVDQGQGATLTGSLQGAGANATICVFSRIVTGQGREFLGVAMTNQGGGYQFAIGAGPSREVSTVYRPDQRELTASATLRTTVHPTLTLRRKVIHNKGFGVFTGSIPGPDNGNVIVVLQVKDGKKWRAFRRYRTREDGQFTLRYRFTHTKKPTTYVARAEVGKQSGYSYEEGHSDPVGLRVLP